MTQIVLPRDNALRPLRASNLTVDLVELAGVTRKFVQCSCGTFAQVKRSQLTAHHKPDGGRCANSRRPLINDLEDVDWASAYDRTTRDVERSRAAGPRFSKPKPPLVQAVAHIGRPRPVHQAQTAGHGGQVVAELDRRAKTRSTN